MKVPIPEPKVDEVLIKVEAATLNPVDWKIQKGALRPFLPRNFPTIPGILTIIMIQVSLEVQIILASLI